MRAHGPCPPRQATFLRQWPLHAQFHARAQRRIGLEVVFSSQGRRPNPIHLRYLPQRLPLTDGVPGGGGMRLFRLHVNAIPWFEFVLFSNFVVSANLPRHQVQILGQGRLRISSLGVDKLDAVNGCSDAMGATQLDCTPARTRLPDYVVLTHVYFM